MNAGVDTLGIFDRLKKSSFTEEQAHAISEIFKDVQEENLKSIATKADLKYEISQLKYDFTLRMGAMLAAAIGILTAIIKLKG